MTVQIKRIMLDSEHENQKWYVLEGSVDGVPSVTKRTTIAVSALVVRPAILDEARAKLESDVAEYYANWLALQAL
jgi:hypothetical protein